MRMREEGLGEVKRIGEIDEMRNRTDGTRRERKGREEMKSIV